MEHIAGRFLDPMPKLDPAKIVNRVALLIDVSGSMYHLRDRLVQLANDQIQKLMELSRKEKQEVYLQIWLFNYRVLMLREGYIHGIGIVNRSEIVPQGGTALYDAYGVAVRSLAGTARPGENTGFLVVGLTDGGDNASNQFSASSALNSIIPSDKEKWTIAALVPRGYHMKNLYGAESRYQVRSWDPTEEGVNEVSETLNRSMTSYAATRSKGATSTSSYFVDPADAAWKGLTPAPKQKWIRIRVDTAGKVEISDFVRSKLGKFKLGEAYYQLTKRERVQAQKQFLVGHYNGDILDGVFEGDVRKAIGLPSGADVRVAPGTTKDPNVKLFVQSTSVNRHLMPGTDLLVLA